MAGELKRLAVCAVMTCGMGALAQEATASAPAAEPQKVPGADAVRDTWNYFYKGQGQGPVLVEAKLCTEVGKEGATKFECTAEVPAEGIKAGSTVMVWQSYLVPQGDTVEDLMVQTKQGSVVRETYGQAQVQERHRHRYEVNNRYRDDLEAAGLVFSGTSPDGTLVEFVELPRDVHPYYVSTQAHPEFLSRPNRAHPLFAGLVGAALERQRSGRLVEVERQRALQEQRDDAESSPAADGSTDAQPDGVPAGVGGAVKAD